MRSVLRRPVLLLSAAVTVAVPGALAVYAVLGHDYAVRTSMTRAEPVAAQAGGHRLATAPRPASQLASAAQASLLPGVVTAGPGLPQASMRAGTAAGIIAVARDQVQGIRLLRQAATSGAVTSYEGVEVISDAAVDGAATVVATVWHRNGVTVTRTAATQAAAPQLAPRTAGAAALAGSQPYVSYGSDDRDPEGVFGVTTALVGLLAKNYVAVYEGEGTVVGRPALIVGVHRADGSLAARFWLDKRTLLPLRRDVFDASAHLVSDEKFVQVRFGPLPRPPTGRGSAAPVADPAWAEAPAPALFLSKLNDQGWLLPATLPGNLGLYAAAQTSIPSGQVIDLGFSDGLSVVSLFVQRGTLPARMPGWQAARVSGHSVYVNGYQVALAARGFVYTLVADAPATVVDQAVAALPRAPGASPGVLSRLSRGLSRLVTLADPFK